MNLRDYGDEMVENTKLIDKNENVDNYVPKRAFVTKLSLNVDLDVILNTNLVDDVLFTFRLAMRLFSTSHFFNKRDQSFDSSFNSIIELRFKLTVSQFGTAFWLFYESVCIYMPDYSLSLSLSSVRLGIEWWDSSFITLYIYMRIK